jgi:quinol monooxygenase YgiN
MAELRVVAVITAKPGSEKEVGEALNGLVAPARAEVGCISYELFASVLDPATFITVETWRSQEDFDAHLKAPYVQQAFASASDHLAQPPVIHPLSPISIG